jgi:TonB family protein
MIIGSILLVGSVALAAQSPTQSAPPPRQQSACAQALADALTDGAAGEICAGDEAARLANAAPKDSTDKTRQWQAAVEHYRKGANITSRVATKVLALNSLTNFYDAQHLNDPRQMEAALREIIVLTPDDLAPMYRLAKSREDQGLIDAAEDTLLEARHKQPDDVEPNRMLAQFYARRVTVTALRKQELQKGPRSASNPGEPDETGVYRVGGAVTPPGRVDVQYPPEALAAGVQGVVVAEIVVDTSGTVTDAKVVRSIPLLDEAALQAVRNWHFVPTVVNGQAVPVRMTVTVNFVPPPTPPATQRR